MSKALTAAITAAFLVGCGGQEATIAKGGADDVASSADELSWSKFLSQVHQIPDQDLFIVNGDSTVEGWKNLRAFYEVAVLGGQQLIIDQTGGVDSKWTDTQKLNLTYCVSNNFGTRKAAV